MKMRTYRILNDENEDAGTVTAPDALSAQKEIERKFGAVSHLMSLEADDKANKDFTELMSRNFKKSKGTRQ